MDELAARISKAFEAAPRAEFLPEKVKHRAHEDRPLPLPRNQTNSQPTTVADMLYLLDVQEGMRVLDVGSGSGWTAALLAELVGKDGEVYGVELEPVLKEFGEQNLRKFDYPWASINQAVKGTLGNAAGGPWDRILVSAAARRMPPELFGQLKEGGILVMPVAGTMVKATKVDGKAVLERHGQYLFVPLR